MSKRVQALAMALETTERERTGAPAPFALCPSCSEPLITTFAWSHYEFYCLNCGAHVDWVGPRKGDPTPELQARYDELHAEWVALGGENLIGGGVMLTDCATCKSRREAHMRHATEAELAAHHAALDRLAERAKAGT